MKYLLIILSLIMLTGLTSAVPQVIFSDINLTINSSTVNNITTGSYRILGDGIDAATTFSVIGNCNFSYQRAMIPITLSREISTNDTDLATLIHALSINNNITYQWQECERNLSVALNDQGYKGNYTVAAAELETCYRNRDSLSSQITASNETIQQLTTWRNFGVGAGIIGIALAIYFYRKQSIRKIPDQYKSVSPLAKQY